MTSPCDVVKSLLWNPLRLSWKILKGSRFSVLTFIGHVLHHLNESNDSAQRASRASLLLLLVLSAHKHVYNDRILLWHYI